MAGLNLDAEKHRKKADVVAESGRRCIAAYRIRSSRYQALRHKYIPKQKPGLGLYGHLTPVFSSPVWIFSFLHQARPYQHMPRTPWLLTVCLPLLAALARRFSSQFEGPLTCSCMGFHRWLGQYYRQSCFIFCK